MEHQQILEQSQPSKRIISVRVLTFSGVGAEVNSIAGLSPQLALASVTSVPASAAGLSHRIGILREGADADVVLWDSHPLQLGATSRKVWIDGILQVDADRAQVPVNKQKKKDILFRVIRRYWHGANGQDCKHKSVQENPQLI